MVKMFLSFSATLNMISAGKIKEKDLNSGLFMFGCLREHAYRPGSNGETDERKLNNGQNVRAHVILVKALKKAEQEGRVGWIRPVQIIQRDPLVVFNEIAEKNGIPALPRDPDYHASKYSYPGFAQLLEKHKSPVTPIFG